jgi:hypothetical protein
MKLFNLIFRVLRRNKKHNRSFSSLFSDAAKDTFKEMGYRFDRSNKMSFPEQLKYQNGPEQTIFAEGKDKIPVR